MNWSEWLNETLKGIQGWSIKSDSNHIMVIKLNQCQILMQVLNNADELQSWRMGIKIFTQDPRICKESIRRLVQGPNQRNRDRILQESQKCIIAKKFWKHSCVGLWPMLHYRHTLHPISTNKLDLTGKSQHGFKHKKVQPLQVPFCNCCTNYFIWS